MTNTQLMTYCNNSGSQTQCALARPTTALATVQLSAPSWEDPALALALPATVSAASVSIGISTNISTATAFHQHCHYSAVGLL